MKQQKHLCGQSSFVFNDTSVWLPWYGPQTKSSILQSSKIKVSISVGKKYDTDEEKLRFSAFSRNIESMEEHNSKAEAGKFTYRLGIHEFSDMVSGVAKCKLYQQSS